MAMQHGMMGFILVKWITCTYIPDIITCNKQCVQKLNFCLFSHCVATVVCSDLQLLLTNASVRGIFMKNVTTISHLVVVYSK